MSATLTGRRPGCALIRRTNHLQRGGECAGKQGENIEQGTVRQQHDLIVERLISRSRIVENRRAPVRTIKSAAHPRRDAACRVARNAIPNHVHGVAIGVGRNRIAVIEIEGSGVSADAGVVDEHGRRIPTRAGAARAGDQNGAATAGAKIVARRKTQSARIHGAVAAEAHPGVRGAFESWHRVLTAAAQAENPSACGTLHVAPASSDQAVRMARAPIPVHRSCSHTPTKLRRRSGVRAHLRLNRRAQGDVLPRVR